MLTDVQHQPIAIIIANKGNLKVLGEVPFIIYFKDTEQSLIHSL